MATAGCKSTQPQNPSVEHVTKPKELALLMKDIQYFSHKLGLAIQSKNVGLAGFYVEELNEGFEEIYAAGIHDNMPIGQVAKSIMPLPLERLEKSIKDENSALMPAYTELVNACNRCHQATQHGFIVIKPPTNNPFNQAFGLPKSQEGSSTKE